ncbi:helix-turn-helix transcriptional regulator [Pedobacter sp. GR22-6]|uniref:helix-turn-helix transcriptional regulator n=1 Tax=Pedobacter sp. GR22-6 TaxID=3127957 RepID=UPI00307D7D2E
MADDLKNFKLKLGKRIKQIRESKNLTQPELGALINKDYQSIGRIENGRVNPSAYLIFQIAKALDVSMGEVFDISLLDE